MKKFLIKIILISTILAIAGWLVFSFIIPQYWLPVFPYLLLFVAAVTTLIHAYQLRYAKKNMAGFTRSTMLLTFFKLVLYSFVAIVYMFFDKANAKTFVICFLILYLVYSIIEVTSSLKSARKGNENG